jgi:hypothetical protein
MTIAGEGEMKIFEIAGGEQSDWWKRFMGRM